MDGALWVLGCWKTKATACEKGLELRKDCPVATGEEASPGKACQHIRCTLRVRGRTTFPPRKYTHSTSGPELISIRGMHALHSLRALREGLQEQGSLQ